ncbi:unnamed protein product [Echinostoma caproni]|uniref:Stathmin n=1 Tax=Echinostoma caproni TaxID=27848 RepID=A0A183AAU7_9TREM|nr:unnamed protein product [Echinostoma caproni]
MRQPSGWTKTFCGLTSMGDTEGKNGDASVPADGSFFFIGETEPGRPIPERLRERLQKKPELPNFLEREKERDKRVQEMRKQKLDKLREHHEKVRRLSEQAKERKRLQEEKAGLLETNVADCTEENSPNSI